MQKLTKVFLEKEYFNAKQSAIFAFNNNQINKALSFCRYAARIAWDYPILSRFCDDELEDFIITTVNTYIKSVEVSNTNRSGIVFYCSWLGDNNALIEQYLYYFIENNLKTLLILPNIKETKFATNILKRISKASNITLYFLRSEKDIEKIQSIRNVVKEFSPEKIFLHFWPNDIIGFAAFAGIHGVNRYFIDHGDHVFWIGKKCSDFFIEFRKFGITLSLKRREIPIGKILHIPFYPINNGTEFKGFPFDRKNKIVLVSGANLYKYYLDPELLYFKTIARLLKENINLIFCLCGSGDPSEINKIFIENNVNNQFFFLGQRNDFYSLVGQCDILLSSYPLTGGLTMLFAIEQKIPVIGISVDYNASGSIQDFLEIKDYLEPKNFEEFYNACEILIRNIKEREKLALLLYENQYKKKCFIKKIDLLMKDEYSSLLIDNNIEFTLKLDDRLFLNEFLDLQTSKTPYFLQKKLFILRENISLKERLVILKEMFKIYNRKSFKEKVRVIILSILGK